jgi:plastocyanin
VTVLRRLALTVLPALAVALAPGPAGGAPAKPQVMIEFASFAPTQIDLLPGETVTWMNMSERSHTVTADDGSFDSGILGGGNTYSLRFATPGAYSYHCSIHPSMTGEVDVRRVILDPLPTLVQKGQALTVSGRSADGQAPVLVQGATASGYETLATATPGSDGSWSATISADSTSEIRAVSGSDASEVRRLLVRDRRLQVRVLGHRIAVSVTPPPAGATVVPELYLRERFGWWPTARRHLDYLSRAAFRVPGPVRARIELVDRDGWTPLIVSAPLRISGPRSPAR